MAHRRRHGAYAASKAAVAALTVALAEEVVKHGILVNAVAPSIMDTPANRRAMPKADYNPWPKVEEVAATILFLASPDNTRHPRRHRAGVREVVKPALKPASNPLIPAEALRDQKRGGRGVRAGPPLPGAPATGRGFIGNRPSRCNFLRASLRARRMASAFSRTLRSDGFS